MDNDGRYSRLRVFNVIIGLLHLGQAAAILLLSNDYSLPVNASFLNYIWETGKMGPVTETLGNLALGPMISLLFFIPGTAHLLLSMPGTFGWYTRNLERGINHARWYEYALGVSLMTVLIAMLCGIYDLVTLLMIFILTAVMNLSGLVMELYNHGKEHTHWAACYVGCLAGIAPWLGIVVYFFGSLATVNSSIPSYVLVVLPVMFLLFFSLIVNMILEFEKLGPWRDYLFSEKAYIILNLVTKSAFAWLIFAGTLRPA